MGFRIVGDVTQMEPEESPSVPPAPIDYDALLDKSKEMLRAAVEENQKGPCPMEIPDTFREIDTMDMGALIEDIDGHMAELHDLVEEMKTSLLTEMRVLEGTKVPEYKENELSRTEE